MPSHVYNPIRNPPTWRDRFLVHSTDTTLAAIAILFGLTAGLSLIFPEFTPSKSMDLMPWFITLLIALFLAVGGTLAIIGLNWQSDDISKGWALEKLGWAAASGGFLTYALSVGWSFPGSLYSWGVPFALGVGSYVRVEALKRIESSVRKSGEEGEAHE